MRYLDLLDCHDLVIEHEPESTRLYKCLFIDYTFGLDRIYTDAEIAAAKQSSSFEREYNLKYLGLIGNVFHTKDIEVAILLSIGMVTLLSILDLRS
jgi:hypothetical protein